jgi:hypothetical protein
MDTAIALIALAVAVVAIVYGAIVLSRRSPAALSEEDGRLAEDTRMSGEDHGWDAGSRGDDVVERPAGPDAEAMGVDDGGRPTTIPRHDVEAEASRDSGRTPGTAR